jgi:hypothetical protein
MYYYFSLSFSFLKFLDIEIIKFYHQYSIIKHSDLLDSLKFSLT